MSVVIFQDLCFYLCSSRVRGCKPLYHIGTWRWSLSCGDCGGGLGGGWLLEQSALHWVTLFNSAHTSRRSHSHNRTQPEAGGAQTHAAMHALAVVHADTLHGHANAHERAHPEAEDIFCHWCLSTDINHRQGKCLCVLLMLAGLQDFYSVLWLCPRLHMQYITTAYSIHHSPMCVLFTSSWERLAEINIFLWSFLTRIIIHMIMWIVLYSESDPTPPWFTSAATIKAIKGKKKEPL